MNIAIIGSGISGLLCARLLCGAHRVSVFEAGDYIGGHTATKTVNSGGKNWNIDTGFIVFNERAYPNFINMLERLGVASQSTDMSFSVTCSSTGLEYCSRTLNTYFAQRRNMLRPGFWRMTRDILRFFKEARELLEPNAPQFTLGEYLQQKGYSREFLEWHLLPLGAAIWSTDTRHIRDCPARFFVRFFDNHGFLQVKDRSPWRTIKGGSSSYIAPLIAPFRDCIRLNCPVQSVRRFDDRVELALSDGERREFDHVIVATHSDQALKLLADPSDAESSVLNAIKFQPSDVVLHTDASLLPKRKRAWASWNYHLGGERNGTAAGRTTVTYDMNILQNLRQSSDTFCVTLNKSERINPGAVLGRYNYAHPLFTPASVSAQARHAEISGIRRTHYCGAYWGYGFHEDGVRSALKVAEHFGRSLAAL